jgi:hypothetical protein
MKATSENSRSLLVRLRRKLSRFKGFCVTYRLVLDWLIGFIDDLYTPARNYRQFYKSHCHLKSHMDWSASRPGRCTSRKRAPGTRWLEGRMLARAGQDSVEKRKSLAPRREWNPGRPARTS